MKRCTKCKRVKPLRLFYKDKRGKYGREARCTRCANRLVMRWAKLHPEKRRAAARRWKERNPEQAKEIAKRCRKTNRDRYLRYRQRQKDKIRRPLLRLQKYRCALCGIKLRCKKLDRQLDHDHRLGCCVIETTWRGLPGCDNCRRGILCHTCNTQRMPVIEWLLEEGVSLASFPEEIRSYLKKPPYKQLLHLRESGNAVRV